MMPLRLQDSWGAGTFITGGDNTTGTLSAELLQNSVLERAQEGTEDEGKEKFNVAAGRRARNSSSSAGKTKIKILVCSCHHCTSLPACQPANL